MIKQTSLRVKRKKEERSLYASLLNRHEKEVLGKLTFQGASH